MHPKEFRAGKELIEIACAVRRKTEKAIGVADGTTEEVSDERTGELREREKLFWLPLSQVADTGDGTVTMPEWLAKDKGLL